MNLREYANLSESAQEEQTITFNGKGKLMQEQAQAEIDRAKVKEILFAFDRARVNASDLTTKILKGCKGAKNPFFLLLDAAECIGLLTDNKTYSEQIKSLIIEEYAQKQSNVQAMELEAFYLNAEIDRITVPADGTNKNLEKLIEAKRKRLDEIISLKDK
jgi:hypothetical protein